MKSAVLYLIDFQCCKEHGKVGYCPPFLYLCYTNELINELVASKFGLKVSTRSVCAPVVADGMLLMALSKFALDGLMKMCFSNGCKCRAYMVCPNALLLFSMHQRISF